MNVITELDKKIRQELQSYDFVLVMILPGNHGITSETRQRLSKVLEPEITSINYDYSVIYHISSLSPEKITDIKARADFLMPTFITMACLMNKSFILVGMTLD